jgi:membrane fusion protein (multidrug efflux system)
VFSPISGRIGRTEVTEGAYVQQGQATLLATVQALDQMYVDLTQSNTEVLRLNRALAAGKLQSAGTVEAKVQLVLDDGSLYADDGKLQFADVTVDSSTGSILLRAVFPNPNRELLPGMFVRARLIEAENPAALLVPQSAVSRSPRGDATALVVGTDNKVELRTLKTERTVGPNWLVTEGLNSGERVIVEGLQHVRPGMPVTPVASSVQPSKT